MSQRRLKDWLNGYVRYTHDTEPPDKFHEWCAVSAISACLERKVFLSLGTGLLFYPNFFIVLTSPAGKARKGTAMNLTKPFITDVGVNVMPEATTWQKLVNVMAESQTSTILCHETGECVIHSSVTVFSSELVVFLGHGDRELIARLCNWYDCEDRWVNDTISRGADAVEGVFLNLIGATTPELLIRSLPSDLVGSGLASRMILVCEKNIRFRQPFPIFGSSDEGKKLKKDLLHDLELIRGMAGQFKVTENFMEMYYDLYMNMPEECPFDPQRFSSYWSRRITHLAKLSMVVSASRSNSMEIRSVDLIRAKELLESTEKNMPFAFSKVGRADYSDVISDVMAFVAAKGETTAKDLLSQFYMDITPLEMEKILGALRDVRYIQTINRGGIEVIKFIERDENG